MNASEGKAAEWKRFWPVPVVAAFGYSSSVLHSYGIGTFMLPLQHEFGWSRALVSSLLTTVGVTDAIMAVPIGMLVDRIGPRRVGLLGALLTAPAFGALGTATGSVANWILLSCLVALAHAGLLAMVWTSAVATCFKQSRGLAFAVTLSGASLSSAIFPLLANWLISHYGWRNAFPMMAFLWMAMVWPLLFFFFRSARDSAAPSAALLPAESEGADPFVEIPGVAIRDGLRSLDFYKLTAASGMFAFLIIGVVVHFVAILRDFGASPLAAAATASVIGISSLAGRLVTGLLLDRFPARFVGAGSMLLPVFGCALLLTHGASAWSATAAAACFGLTLGSEVDVVAYLASHRFGLKHFGVFNGVMTGALAIGVASGPLAAGAAYDHSGSYTSFLFAVIGLSVVSSLALGTIRGAAHFKEMSGASAASNAA